MQALSLFFITHGIGVRRNGRLAVSQEKNRASWEVQSFCWFVVVLVDFGTSWSHGIIN